MFQDKQEGVHYSGDTRGWALGPDLTASVDTGAGLGSELLTLISLLFSLKPSPHPPPLSQFPRIPEFSFRGIFRTL